MKHCKVIIVGTFGMPRYAHPNWYCQFVENDCAYLQGKNWLHTPRLRDCKDIQTSYFAYFGHASLCKPKIIVYI